MHDLNLALKFADKIATSLTAPSMHSGRVGDVLTRHNLGVAFRCKVV